MGLPNPGWSVPYAAAARPAASIRRSSYGRVCEKPESQSTFTLLSKTGSIATGFSNQAGLQVHLSLIVTTPVFKVVPDSVPPRPFTWAWVSSVHAQKGYSPRSSLACLKGLDHVWAESIESDVWTNEEVATVPEAQRLSFRSALHRTFLTECRPIMRGTFEPLDDAGLSMACDMFWERFEGYLFAQYFSQCLAGDFTIAVSSLEGPVLRWKAVEICQCLRFDYADASFGAGRSVETQLVTSSICG